MDWFNACGMLVLVIGHCELLVTIVNRTHSFPIHFRPLRQFRHFDDLMIPLFPAAFVWLQGLNGAQLLRGGAWEQLPTRWIVYLSLCAAGFVGFLYSVVRWQLYRPPEAHVSTSEEILDVQAKLETPLFRPGPYSFLARVPGNECLQLSIARKTFCFPQLPPEWDGLTITQLSDLHFIGTIDRAYFAEVMRQAAELNSDLLVLTGDIIDDMRLVDWLIPTLAPLNAPLGRYFLLGNHDWDLEPDTIRQHVLQTGWTDLGSRAIGLDIQGHRLALGGTEFPWLGHNPDFTPVGDSDFRILLSHSPDTFDWAVAQDVDLVLAGHNHGGQVQLPVIGPVYSPSRYGVKYAGGTFAQGKTLLHVSRGLAGRHPLRLNCRPELVQIRLVRHAEPRTAAQNSASPGTE